MRTTKLSFIRILVVVALALLANGCSARIVVDENGKPLAGVHVVAYYRAEGPRFYTSYYKCIRVEALITGADGHFDFPFFSGNFNPWLFKRTAEIGYFKPGYELEPNQDEFVSPVRMRQFSGDMKRRFAPGFAGDYGVFNARARCPQLGKKLYPLLLAIHSDAKQLAKTYEERSSVIEIEYDLETIQKETINGEELYDKPAMDRSSEKRRQLKKEMGINK